MTAVFPELGRSNESNGGFDTREEFACSTLEGMLTESGGDENICLISRPTPEKLKDYDGDNLIMAFPLQFPYGIGGMDITEMREEVLGFIPICVV